MDYSEALTYLYHLQRYGIRSALEVIVRLCEALDRPHERFPSVLIGGTNGKGSTAAILASILQAGGHRVGLYTSPHLTDFSERIRVDGEPIPREAVVAYTEQLRALAGAGLSPTFFEFATAMAFLHFARRRVDFAVIEVGMGGRLDATNVLSPLLSVITNVDYDHEAFLGSSLEAIAEEKAGIIKRSTPVVSAATQPEVVGILESVCRRREGPLTLLGRDVKAFVRDDAGPDAAFDGLFDCLFDYQGLRLTLKDLSVSLAGRHQALNAAAALAAAEVLMGAGVSLNEAALREGLRTVRWEGRLQAVGQSPLILLDGAHNPAGARVLAVHLAGVKRIRGGRLYLAAGILADKDVSKILAPLAPLADEVIITRPDYSGAASLHTLRLALKDHPVKVSAFEKIPEALAYAVGRLRAGGRADRDFLCVTGSLYTVGAAKAFLEGRESPWVFRG